MFVDTSMLRKFYRQLELEDLFDLDRASACACQPKTHRQCQRHWHWQWYCTTMMPLLRPAGLPVGGKLQLELASGLL